MATSTRTFLAALSACLALVVATCAGLRATSGGTRSLSGAVLTLRLEGDLPEQEARGPWGAVFGEPALTLHQLVQALDAAALDPEIAGAEVRVGYLDVGWARAREIREALLRFRASGKPLHAFVEEGDDGTFYVASAADDVRMLETGTLWVDGLSAEVTFYGGTFEKVGVHADLEQVGEYKNAADVMTRKTMSEAHRRSVDSLLDGLFDVIVDDLARSRGGTADEVRALISGGPYTATDALEAGLVDALGYRDDAASALDEALAAAPGAAPPQRIEVDAYLQRLTPRRASHVVAVVHCGGTIAPGDSADGLLGGTVVGSDTIAAAIREATEEDGATAIVLRVDSPGGSVVASDLIWRAVRKAQDAGVVVVVSMADVAASGGYWIATGADRVVAQPSTITGSIGIYGGKYVTEELWKKADVATESFARGRNAGINSPLRPYTPQQREWIRRSLQAGYQSFLQKTVDGRGFPDAAAVDEVARGRVWTGQQALELGLVDDLGGLDRALEVVREIADLGDEPVEVRSYPRSPGLIEAVLESGVGASLRAAARREAAAELAREIPSAAREAASAASIARLLQREGALAWLPWKVTAH